MLLILLTEQMQADNTAEFPQEIYSIDRKATETREIVEFELAAPTDLAGVRIPGRQVLVPSFLLLVRLYNDLEIQSTTSCSTRRSKRILWFVIEYKR